MTNNPISNAIPAMKAIRGKIMLIAAARIGRVVRPSS